MIKDPPRKMSVQGLDSIRFLAAIWVAFGHGAFLNVKPLLPEFPGKLLAGALGVSFNGIAAVMVFFIVSGFCIHLPYARARSLPIMTFYVRRYIRIGIPLAVATAIMSSIGGLPEVRGHEVLWSVYVELIYYTIYPVLFLLASKFGMLRLVQASFVVSAVITIFYWRLLYIWEFGWLTWLWGLPIWLMGCLLAEKVAKHEHLSDLGNIWLWRFLAFTFSVATTILIFHSNIVIGYGFSMLAFSVFAFFWISREVQHSSSNGVFGLLEYGGNASYSIYLMHNIVLGALIVAAPTIGSVNELWILSIKLVCIFGASLIFYLLVEAPSHALARRLGAVVKGIRFHREPLNAQEKSNP